MIWGKSGNDILVGSSGKDSFTFDTKLGANNVDFNLSFIGNEVPTSPTLFDTAYMRRLYDYGFARGRSGDFWQKQPPSAAQQAVTGEP